MEEVEIKFETSNAEKLIKDFADILEKLKVIQDELDEKKINYEITIKKK